MKRGDPERTIPPPKRGVTGTVGFQGDLVSGEVETGTTTGVMIRGFDGS